MTGKEAIDKAGSVSALARILGVSRQAVQQWRWRGLPDDRKQCLRELRPEWFIQQPVMRRKVK